MDLALAIENLVPAAQYGGSTTANDQAAFNALVWEDGRAKPNWTQIQNSWTTVQAKQAKKATFDAAVAAGYAVSPENFNIPFDPNTRADMQGLGLTIKEAVDTELKTNSDTTSIFGHSMTILRARQILVGYAFAYKTIYDASL